MLLIYIKDYKELASIQEWKTKNNILVEEFFVNENVEHGARARAHGIAIYPVLFSVTPLPENKGESLKIYAQGPGTIEQLSGDILNELRTVAQPPPLPNPFE